MDLYRDYKGHYGSRIQFNKDLTIDGHGHKLDGLDEGGCSAFYSSSGTITLKNLVICNCHNDYTENGGAIYCGADNIKIINSTFKNNRAEDECGGALYICKNSYLENSTFISNSAKVNGGPTHSYFYCYCYDCTFESNTAGESGGAVYHCYIIWLNQLVFKYNTANATVEVVVK